MNPPRTSNPTGGAITGLVTQHGKGLGDVLVRAWRQPSSQAPLEGGGLEAKTDIEGNYRIISASPGNYYVAVDRPGLVAEQKGLSGSPRAVSVSAGETVASIDFQLFVGGVITGRVTKSDGSPLIDEPVMLTEVTPQPNPTLSFPNPVMLPFVSGLFKTDDRGVYRVFGIPPGSYKVSAGAMFTAFTALRGQPSYRRTFYPATTDEARARAIEVTEEAVISNIDINVGSAVPTFSAKGRIVNRETGQAIPDISYDIHIGGPTRGTGQISKAGSSNDMGEFKIENLPAGRYTVKISEPSSSAAAETGRFFGESDWFEIRDSEVSGIEVKATKTLAVSGVVIVRNTTDKTILARASQVTLLFEVLPKAGGPYAFQAAKVEPDLTFSVHGLKPGKLRILLNSREDGLMGLRFSRMELSDSTPVREIEINGDGPITGVRVVLVYGSGSVRGLVKFENGSLPEGVRVSVRVTNDEGFYAGSWADPRGSFRIEAVPAGNYTLTVGAEVPGKRTLGKAAHQPISVSESGETQATIALDLTEIAPSL